MANISKKDWLLGGFLAISVISLVAAVTAPESLFHSSVESKKEVVVNKIAAPAAKNIAPAPKAKPAKKEVHKEISVEQLVCMADNIYFEARGESREGWAAVNDVVLNRVASKKFPNTPCQVIKQKRKNVCQFSWVCDKRFANLDSHCDTDKYIEILAFVTDFHGGLTKGATFYHATRLSVKRLGMGNKITHTVTVGKHKFYRI